MVVRILGSWIALAVLLLARSPAAEANEATLTYDSKFEEVTNNCPKPVMQLEQGVIRVQAKGGTKIEVAIQGAPNMAGTRRASDKIKAEGRGKTPVEGATAMYSVAGRANETEIQILFIVELYRGKKPLCTQSWSALGKRKK